MSIFGPDLIWRIIAFLIAIVLHELAHGYVAHWLGDPTPKQAGRLTLNPVSHLDPLGLLMLLFGPFGWAKPVPVDLSRLRVGRRLGIFLVAAAGPAMNILLAVLFGSLLTSYLNSQGGAGNPVVDQFLSICVILNVVLAAFNILPIPPLDGSKILFSVIPRTWYRGYFQYERYGPFLLLLLFITPLSALIIQPIQGLLLRMLGFA